VQRDSEQLARCTWFWPCSTLRCAEASDACN